MRVLLLWHFVLRQDNCSSCFIRDLELEADKKTKSQRTISAIGLLESYREYLNRRSVLQSLNTNGWNIKQWERVCTQLVKLMHLVFQLEVHLEN